MQIKIDTAKVCLPGTLLFALSFASLAFYLMPGYALPYVLTTVVGAFGIALYLVRKTGGKWHSLVKAHKVTDVVLAILTAMWVYAMYQGKGMNHLNLVFQPLTIRFFAWPWWIVTMPAAFYVLTMVWDAVRSFVSSFWREMDTVERRVYLAATVTSVVVIPVLYFMVPQWFMQYDLVYSMDAGFCYEEIFGNPMYYDIRHPLLGLVAFPMWAWLSLPLHMVLPAAVADAVCAACLQLLHVQILLLAGLIIGKLAHSRWVTWLYYASAPVLLFAVTFEKYQLCILFLILYAWLYCREKRWAAMQAILATGAMPTSAAIFVMELVRRESLREKCKRVVSIGLKGVALLICVGMVRLLNPMTLLVEMGDSVSVFGNEKLSLGQSLNAFTNMVQASFTALPSSVSDVFTWNNVIDSLSIPGAVLFLLAVIGVAAGRKEVFFQLCGVWTLVSVVLIGIIRWGAYESPLFCLYFSWALVPLVYRGICTILNRFKIKKGLVFGVMIVLMLAVNLVNLGQIGAFLA